MFRRASAFSLQNSDAKTERELAAQTSMKQLEGYVNLWRQNEIGKPTNNMCIRIPPTSVRWLYGPIVCNALRGRTIKFITR